ncbi:hypothetical protein KV205_25790 [Streptomyces sp. SKN60]|uniref:phage baseplate assembly protein V n=1 Tax=Streptomyces sp. SKN60 TaxID=2855506 RepID=UPI0022465928|nr:phage baseplate assembly protein V [Streptomyces sp. SKN60]MCX2183918.1 hypothetical protein [Streptomyces sp. SKN60]
MSRYGDGATPDRPEFEVRIGGTALAPLVQRDVVEIDVSEEVGRHGRLSLVMQNWDADTRTVRHSDGAGFAPGRAVEVLLGYHSDLSPVFAGVITSLTAHFPHGGRPLLRVEARSRSVLLDHPPHSRQFTEVTDADVVAAIAADHGLTADAATGVTRPAVVFDRTGDWDWLTARAAELGWVTYVRDTTLVFRAPAGESARHSLEYGLNITELHLTQDLTRAVDPVVAAGWDVATLEVIEQEAGPSQAGLDLGGRPDHGAALADAGWPLRAARPADPAIGSAEAVDALATGAQRRAALGHLYGTARLVGNAALRCDQWISVSGVGERMSGPHYLTAVRHRLSDQGYCTEIQVGSPPVLAPRESRGGACAGGLVIGVVASLEDPEGLNRARVTMPWRGDDGEGVWARLATLDAGDGFGTVFSPSVGQEVLVGRLNGDPSELVVLGSLYNGTQQPPVPVTDDANQVRAIVTPGGHTLRLEDGDSSAVTVETPAGNRLLLAESDSTVSLTHGDSGNSLTLSADGITIEAARGDIVLKAPSGAVKLDGVRIEGASTGPSKFASSATFDLSASATVKVSGALVTIN